MNNEKPQVITSTNASKEYKRNNGVFKNNVGKILFIVFILALLFEVGYFYNSWRSSMPVIGRITDMTDPQLALVSDKNTYRVGNSVPVRVKVSTGGHMVDSLDTIIRYNTSDFDASTSAIQTHQVFPEYPVVEVDRNEGVIRISGTIKPNTEGFNAVGDLATISLTAKRAGKSTLSFDYQSGSTIDTNVVDTLTGNGLNTNVTNLDLTISNDPQPSEELPAKTSCDGYYRYCTNYIGQTGKQYCNAGTVNSSVCSYDPKFTTTCGPCILGR